MPNTPDRNYNVGQSMINDQHDGGPGVPYHNVVITLNAPLQTVTAAALTTGVLVTHTLDALTTGGALVITSDSSSTGTRNLVSITNDNTAATGAICLHLKQDAASEAMSIDMGTLDKGFIDFQATADADATSAISTLNTTGTATDHIQISLNGASAWIPCSTTDPS